LYVSSISGKKCWRKIGERNPLRGSGNFGKPRPYELDIKRIV
jgi:hypothetical protein